MKTRQQINTIQKLNEELEDKLRDYKIELTFIEELDKKIADQYTLEKITGADRSSQIRQIANRKVQSKTILNHLEKVIGDYINTIKEECEG